MKPLIVIFLLLYFVFGGLFGTVGFALGSVFWTSIGVIFYYTMIPVLALAALAWAWESYKEDTRG